MRGKVAVRWHCGGDDASLVRRRVLVRPGAVNAGGKQVRVGGMKRNAGDGVQRVELTLALMAREGCWRGGQ